MGEAGHGKTWVRRAGDAARQLRRRRPLCAAAMGRPGRLQYPANALVHRGELLAYIASDRIKSNAQLDGAFEYLGKVRGVGGWCARLGGGRRVVMG